MLFGNFFFILIRFFSVKFNYFTVKYLGIASKKYEEFLFITLNEIDQQ